MGEPYLSKSMEVGTHVSDILIEAKLGGLTAKGIFTLFTNTFARQQSTPEQNDFEDPAPERQKLRQQFSQNFTSFT